MQVVRRTAEISFRLQSDAEIAAEIGEVVDVQAAECRLHHRVNRINGDIHCPRLFPVQINAVLRCGRRKCCPDTRQDRASGCLGQEFVRFVHQLVIRLSGLVLDIGFKAAGRAHPHDRGH